MENKFYNELRKFKKAEKVELGIVQDLNKNIKRSETLLKQSDKVIQKIEKAMKVYNDAWEATRVLNKEISDRIKSNKSAVSSAEQMAKKLGVNIKDIKEIGSVDDVNNKLERELNALRYPSIN